MNAHRKGWAWRRAVELWLQDQGFETTCRPLGYPGDDIVAVHDPVVVSVEAKNCKALELASFVDQAEANAHGAIPVVFAHRRGRASVDDAYVVMSGRGFAHLLAELTEALRELGEVSLRP